MLAAGEIPHQLQVLLSDPRIKKVGRLVSADLKYLQSACQSPTSFVGALDLAKYAKDRRVTPNATCSLEDLCAKVLGKHLNKNVSECVSQAWENEVSTPDQLSYAATDAYAALLLYQTLSLIQVPQSLQKDAPRGTPVLIYSADNTVAIAQGQLSHVDWTVTESGIKSFNNIKITSMHTLVDVQEIYVPGAVVSSHRKKALNTFGDVPFSLLCLWSHLREVHPLLLTTSQAPLSNHLTLGTSSNPDSYTLSGDLDSVYESEGSGISISDIILDKVKPSDVPSSQTGPQEVDPSSASQGKSILGGDSDPLIWDDDVQS